MHGQSFNNNNRGSLGRSRNFINSQRKYKSTSNNPPWSGSGDRKVYYNEDTDQPAVCVTMENPTHPGIQTGHPPSQDGQFDNSSESFENKDGQDRRRSRSGERGGRRSKSGDRSSQRQDQSGDRNGQRQRSGERGQRQRSGERGQRQRSGERGQRQRSGERGGKNQYNDYRDGPWQLSQGNYPQNRHDYDNANSYGYRNREQQTWQQQGQHYGRGGYPGSYRGGSYRGGYQNNYGQQRGRQRGKDDDLVSLSKTLSSILRHNAERFGFKLMKGGFLYVDELLQSKKLYGYTLEDVQYVVESNDKKRFSLEQEANGRWKIRANQGHSLEVEELDLKPILSADEFPLVIHGTYYQSWEAIKKTGLCRMNRNHIHFAAGEPGSNGVISGMRSSCEVMIYIDMEKALKDGLKFYLSSNNVILCPGNEEGFLFPCYFQGVMDRRNYHRINFDSSISSLKRLGASEVGAADKSKKKKGSKKNKEKREEENWEDDVGPQQGTSKQPDNEDSKLQSSQDNYSDESSPTKVEPPKREKSPEKEITEPPVKKETPVWSDSPTVIDEVDCCASAVDHILDKKTDKGFLVVCCCGKGLGTKTSKLTTVMLLAFPEIYVFKSEENMAALMSEGGLKKIFLSQATKIFHNIEQVSYSLIHEFDILMNGVPIWDISLFLDKLNQFSSLERENFEEKFGIKITEFAKKAKGWAIENEELADKMADASEEAIETLMKRGKMIDNLYIPCFNQMTDDVEKKLKKETFALAIPDKDPDLAEKIEELKRAAKGKGAKKEQGAQQKEQKQPPQSSKQQHQKSKKKKGKK